jgi:molybdenum cofactor cytidylyltransferase
MKFASFPVTEAHNMIMGHSIHADDVWLKKGQRLDEAAIQILKNAGIDQVYAAQLDSSDVAEDIAAETLAKALAGANTRADTAFTGRANLYAKASGLVQLDEPLIHKVNAIDEALTIATLKNCDMVQVDQMLATIKIIPFAIPDVLLEKAMQTIAEHSSSLSVSPFVLKKADLILTSLPGRNPKLTKKAERTVTDRLSALGIKLCKVNQCAHSEADIAAQLENNAAADSELTLILGSSATVDRHDVVPSGICNAGGTIHHFGMPVDPGNLLLLGEYNDRPVIGLPGCARSPKLNGADWVLQRLAANLPVTSTDLQSMGVGGLLKEIPSRPQPRAKKTMAETTPRIAAIILAAGQSRRMGDINKLTASIGNKPMVSHVADAALSSKADEIILVTGYQEELVLSTLAGRPLTHVHNSEFEKGLSTSVKTGINALTNDTLPLSAAIILLGDMPYISAKIIDTLIDAHNPEEEAFICVPTVNGKRGNPVLWDATFFPELENLQGDVGAKHLIVDHADLVREVPIDGTAPITDIDTPQMLSDQQNR